MQKYFRSRLVLKDHLNIELQTIMHVKVHTQMTSKTMGPMGVKSNIGQEFVMLGIQSNVGRNALSK